MHGGGAADLTTRAGTSFLTSCLTLSTSMEDTILGTPMADLILTSPIRMSRSFRRSWPGHYLSSRRRRLLSINMFRSPAR
jgi:hypothetical protein